jgi:hypothetical protein
MSYQNVLLQLDSIKTTITNSLNIEEVIQSANQALSYSQGKYSEGLAAINKLKQLDKRDERVVEVLVKFVQQLNGYDDWQENAVISLGQFPSK